MRSFLSTLFCAFALIITPAFTMLAQDGDAPTIDVESEIDKAQITIGEPLEYKVTVRHGPNVKIYSSIPAPSAEAVKVTNIEDIRESEDDQTTQGKLFTLTTYRLGNFILDPVEIKFRENGGEIRSLHTEKIYFTVKSVAEGEEKQDIRGVKSVETMPQIILKWTIILAAATLILSIAAWLWAFFIRKKQSEATKETFLTPDQEAILHLQQLIDSDLIKREKYKEYYLKLSEILRVYFEKRFDIHSVEATTIEICRELRSHRELTEQFKEKVKNTLEFADLVKFAKWVPRPMEVVHNNKKSMEIVEESKPFDHAEQGDVQHA